MDVSNWINLGIFLLTAIAVWVAIDQAREARTQRIAADKASVSAGEHEAAALDAASRSAIASERAASEQGRAADALEKQATLAELVSRPEDPWLFEALSPPNMDQRWRVENRTGEKVVSVVISSPSLGEWILPEGEDVIESVDPGESIFFEFKRRYTSPTSATVWVLWGPSDGSGQKKFTKFIS